MKERLLCIEYARNRIALKAVKYKISSLVEKNNHKIDLSKYRNEFFEEYTTWMGWVCALVHVGEFTDEELKLATLLDEKKEIIIEAGTIKRKIYFAGISAINRDRKGR